MHGHIEDESSMNRGNFLEILNLVANHDPVIKDQLKNVQRMQNIHLLKQNSLISVMAGTVQGLICSSVRKAGAYKILADETKDCSKKE